jgi:hypothetical protein
MGKGTQLFLKRWVGLTRNGDDRKTQEGRSSAGAAVGAAEEEPVSGAWRGAGLPGFFGLSRLFGSTTQ